MENNFFKSVIDADDAPVVICDLEHTIVYMNPTAVKRYEKPLQDMPDNHSM